MKRIATTLVLYLNCIIAVFAQKEYFTVNSPRSPESASFTRFMELPVSPYTGALDVSIPLYNIQLDNVSVPINLSYHSAGVRVEEEASWVGLGWNLAAGGCISRRVDDRPDEFSNGWQENNNVFNYPSILCGNSNEYYFQKNLNCYNYSSCNCNGTSDGSVGADQLDIIRHKNFYDFKPDIYSYSFGGHSGTFSFDKSGNLVKRELNNLRITKKIINSSSVPEDISWEITDEYGNVYEFNKKQYSYIELDNEEEYVSAWFITKITTPNSKTIEFEYNTDESPYVVGMSMFSQSYDCLNESFHGNTPYTGQFTETVNVNSRVYLSRIITSEGNSVKFTLGSRRDLENASRLDGVEVRNSNNEIVKKYDFSYSYLVSTPDPISSHQASYVNSKYKFKLQFFSNYNNTVVYDTAYVRNTHRLNLDSIQEVSFDGAERINPYKFTYNPIILPVKLSYSVDHWGYFNGAPNTNKLPTVIDFVSYLAKNEIYHTNEFLKFWQANRQQNESYGKSCMLEQITYPTMGRLTIQYEPNTFTNINKFEPYTTNINGDTIVQTIGYGGGFRVKNVINTDPISGSSITKTFNYYNGILVCVPNYVRYERDYFVAEGACVGLFCNDPPSTQRFEFDRILVTSYSNSSSSNSMSGSHVGYSKVEEIITNQTQTIKTEYNYLNQEEIFCGVLKEYGATVPSIPNLSNGLLISKKEYNNNIPVRNTSYAYNTVRVVNNYGMNVFYKSLPQGNCNSCSGELQKEDIRLVFINQFSNWNKLTSTTEEVDGVTTTKSYFYDNPQLYQVSRISTTLSDNTIETQKIKYPLDFTTIPAQAPLNTMRDKNMVNYPIETQVWKNDKLISAVFNKYENSITPRIKEVYTIETNTPLTEVAFIGLDQYGNFRGSTHYKLITTIHPYDDYGNPLTVLSQDGLTTTYTWGYNGQYLTSKTIKETDNSSSPTLTESWDWYPLKGMKWHIDQTGLKTTYEYDSFGRLQTVTNNKGEILQHYEYHYKQ